MTNREKLIKEHIAKLDDEYLFDEFCRYRTCKECAFRDFPLGCEYGFEEWLYEEEEKEQ